MSDVPPEIALPGRKIVQIAVASDVDSVDRIMALCDDGTVWILGISFHNERVWQRLPGVPKEDIAVWQPKQKENT
jgi:hypothetical protein